jgi:hypothetical protein
MFTSNYCGIMHVYCNNRFTSRMSAVSLLYIAYARLSDATRTEVRKIFYKLCSDDTPMVCVCKM